MEINAEALKCEVGACPGLRASVTPSCFNPQSDELGLQKKLRTEVIQLEDTLAQVRKEYEMLRIEFEQNLAANEQAGMWQGQVEGGHLGLPGLVRALLTQTQEAKPCGNTPCCPAPGQAW